VSQDPDESMLKALNATRTVSPPISGVEATEVPRFCKQGGMVGHPDCAEGGLDSKVFEHARRGFGIMSGVFAGAILFALLQGIVAVDVLGWEPPSGLATARVRQVVLFLLSIGMFLVTRTPTLCPRTVARLGHVYQLAGALVIALADFGAGPLAAPLSTLSWLALWIVIFPLVAPGKLRVTVGVAVASAALVPAVLIGGGLLRGDLVGFPVLFSASMPYFAAAVIAVVPTLLLQRLSQDMSEARDALQDMGTYRLLEQLGAGGMGEVWRAEHRMLRRPAAIKVIRPRSLEGGTPAEREQLTLRFEREATITASLRSPHTVDLYDFGYTGNGDFYYVMELLDGVDLYDLVKVHGALSPARAVHLLRQVCGSLAEAHARGLVHRDLKPANVMVCRMGLETDFVKVLDFGLVSALTTEQDVRLTGENAILGTPAFMSPEQAQGGVVDSRSDVYALGCLAYWLVTGQLVFNQTQPLAMILDHVNTAPQRPTDRLERPLPPEFEDLILECLAKNPAERPCSARELSQRLAACDVGTWSSDESDAWWSGYLPSEEDLRSVDPNRASTVLLGV
jgi:serine/threonine protein kinase